MFLISLAPDFVMEGNSDRAQRWLRNLGQNLEGIFDLESSGRLILYSAVVGAVAGLGAALFSEALTRAERFILGDIVGYHPPSAGGEVPSNLPVVEPSNLAASEESSRVATVQMPTRWWVVLLVPAIGGLACGYIVYRFAPEAEGHGTDALVHAFHQLKGAIRGRVPLVKGLASVLTIGTGGSAGREGPIAQIGAGVGSFLGRRLGLSDWERRLLMLAGAAGGIGAIFHAPLGGALFVCEVLYVSTAIEFSALVPAVCSSVVAYTVFTSIYGLGDTFTIPEPPDHLMFHGAHELPFYLLFAVICALAGWAYVRFFYGLRDRLFHRLPMPRMLKPALGGLVLGVIALFWPQVMAGGYGWIQQAINGNVAELTVGTMLILALAKIVATSFTISSGGSGGVFAPSLFIGAMLGGAYGSFCHQWFPDYVPQPEAYVLVGMGGFFAGVAKVPLTALIMVSEMTGSYDLLVPLMLTSIVSVAILASRVSLYEEQVTSLIDSPAHLGDFVVDVLARIHVREVYRRDRPIDAVPEDMPLSRVVSVVAGSENSYFPVVDTEQRMVGIFSLRDIRSALEGNGVGDLVVASDIATFPVLTVVPNDDLHTALRRFTQKNIDEIPVVDPQDPTRVLGMLRRKEVIAAYDEQLAGLRHQK